MYPLILLRPFPKTQISSSVPRSFRFLPISLDQSSLSVKIFRNYPAPLARLLWFRTLLPLSDITPRCPRSDVRAAFQSARCLLRIICPAQDWRRRPLRCVRRGMRPLRPFLSGTRSAPQSSLSSRNFTANRFTSASLPIRSSTLSKSDPIFFIAFSDCHLFLSFSLILYPSVFKPS